MTDPEIPLFTTRHIAHILGVSTEYVRRQVHEGKLHATTKRLSHHRTLFRFTLNDVLAYDPDAARRLANIDCSTCHDANLRNAANGR